MVDARDSETYAIIGAAMEVHRVLGNGFLEAVYQEALAIEFDQRKIPFIREPALDVGYKGHILSCQYRADFICYQHVIIEIKALKQLSTHEQSQAINYLKAAGIERALLINFGNTSLQHRRLVRTAKTVSNSSS